MSVRQHQDKLCGAHGGPRSTVPAVPASCVPQASTWRRAGLGNPEQVGGEHMQAWQVAEARKAWKE